LWGRFALRNQLSKTVLVNNDAQLAEYLNDHKIEFSLIDQIDDFTTMLVFRTKDEFIMENASSNIIVAAWTTACGRVQLLKALQKLLKRKDVRIIYMDTVGQKLLIFNKIFRIQLPMNILIFSAIRYKEECIWANSAMYLINFYSN
jgi:hypothetical protein